MLAPSAPVVPRVVPLVAGAEGNSIRVNPGISASTNTSCHVMQEIFPVVVVCGVSRLLLTMLSVCTLTRHELCRGVIVGTRSMQKNTYFFSSARSVELIDSAEPGVPRSSQHPIVVYFGANRQVW